MASKQYSSKVGLHPQDTKDSIHSMAKLMVK